MIAVFERSLYSNTHQIFILSNNIRRCERSLKYNTQPKTQPNEICLHCTNERCVPIERSSDFSVQITYFHLNLKYVCVTVER